MTCIVGLEHGGHVYLGGDSAGVAGLDVVTRLDEKVFKNEGMVMGFTTSFRMGQLLRYAFVPPEKSEKKDDMAYLVTDFIDGIRSVYKEKGYLKHDADDDGTGSESGGTFLLGYKDRLYVIDNDFQVGRTGLNFAACGCGESYALGSLFSSKHIKDPLERLNLALEAAQEFSGGVRAPFNFVSTKHDGYITKRTK